MPDERPDNPTEPQDTPADRPEDAASAALRAAREALASIQAEANAAAAGHSAPPDDEEANKSQVEADAEAQMMADLLLHAAKQSSAPTPTPAPAQAQAVPGGGGGAVDLGPPPRGTKPLELPDFDLSGVAGAQHGLDLLADVQLDVRIELGRTRMLVEDVLRLNAGAVVELDKLAGDPLDVFVNDRLVARGEVLVLNDNFCIRVNEIIDSLGEGDDRPDS